MDHVRLGRLLLGNGGLREDLLDAVGAERARLPRRRWRRAAAALGVALSLALLVALVGRRGPDPAAPQAVTAKPDAAPVGEAPARRYDFQNASQFLDWGVLAHRAARAQLPQGMQVEGEAACLRNAEAVLLAGFRGEARISATVWQDAHVASPCFGLFAGPIAWAVVTDDRTALLPRSGGPSIQSEPSPPPPPGTRLRVEMSIARGRATCTLDGRVVFDRAIEGDQVLQLGVFAFRDTRIGFDDVVVSGTPDATHAAGRKAREESLAALLGRHRLGTPVDLTDGNGAGALSTHGDWRPVDGGLRGTARGGEGSGRSVAQTDVPEEFRLRMAYRFEEGHEAELLVCTGEAGSSARFTIPAEPAGVWRTIEVLAIDGRVRCVVDGEVMVLPDAEGAPRGPRRFVGLAVGRGALSIGRTTLEELLPENRIR